MIDERNDFLDYVSNVAYSIPLMFGMVDGVNPFRAKKSSQARGLATMFNLYNTLSSTRQSCADAKIVSIKQLQQELGLRHNRVNDTGYKFMLFRDVLGEKYLDVLELLSDRVSDKTIESKRSGLKTIIRISVESVRLEDLFRLSEIVTDSMINIAVGNDKIAIIQFFNGERHGRLWVTSQLWRDIAQSVGLRPDNQQQILRSNQQLLSSYAIHLERESAHS